MRLGISEILSNTSKLSSDEEKIQYLQANDSVPLKQILKYTFDKTIKFNLPEGEPPFTPNAVPGSQTNLYQEARRLYLFIEGSGAPNLPTMKRENLFIQSLEFVDPQDAKLLCAMKDKMMPYEGITGSLVNQAFPGLIVESIEETNEAPPQPVRKATGAKKPSTKKPTAKKPSA